MRRSLRSSMLAILAFGFTFTSVSVAQAGRPVLDTGIQISEEKPYESAQQVGSVYENRSIYGKLLGDTPIDIYKLTPDKDGEQTFTLLGERLDPSMSRPVLIFVDPTDATQGEELRLPVPAENYHTTLFQNSQSEVPRMYTESLLMQRYEVLSENKVKLKKDTTYYLVVIDPYRQSDHYVIKLGQGKSWTAADVVQNLGSWFRLQTDSYAKSSPFVFTGDIMGFIFLILGLCALVGIQLIQETFSFMANKFKAAGYILIKMQPYARIYVWIALWFMAVGSYMFFSKAGWVGLPFALCLLYIPIILNLLFQTFYLSPRLEKLEVNKREATIPFDLRKRWFFSTLVSFFSLGAFIVFLGIFLANN